jgi:hypothetical protein
MRRRWGSALGAALCACALASVAVAQPAPPQRLNSAVLIYPLVRADTEGGVTRETRIDLLNLTGLQQHLHCFFVEDDFCNETGFFITLTPNQPVSWLVSQGFFSNLAASAVPPFHGSGELKCIVQPNEPTADSHNAIQGRAIVFGSDGQTLGYGAVAFRRLADGDFDGEANLDGSQYTACPDEQHFAFLADPPRGQSGPVSELILAPCSEDLENQTSTSTNVQFVVVNEFEQHLSASVAVNCYLRRALRDISSVFTSTTLGSDTGHLIVRGVQSPVSAIMIDNFAVGGNLGAAANEPALKDGRAAVIRFP